MSECVESVPADAETKQLKEKANLGDLEVESGITHEKGDEPKKLDRESEVCEESKDEKEVDASQQTKRKSLEDGEREDDVTKKVRKDEDDDYGGDEEATSEKTDENDDAAEKDAEGAEEAAEDAASDGPAS